MIRERLNELLAEKRVANKRLEILEKDLAKIENKISELNEAQVIFQTAAKIMYGSLSSKLGDIVTEGLNIIFPEAGYRFIIEFIERRSTIECDLYLLDQDDKRLDPLTSVGGGVADVISMLLRCTYIILNPSFAKVLIADEPFRFVDRERIPEAALFLRKICENFGLQVIVITHIPELMLESEKVYVVTKTKGISSVRLGVN